jgi:glycosyltransferase involved in cell wall biosynthesis
LRTRLGQAARERVVLHYTWEQLAPRAEAAYQRARQPG